MGVNLVSLPLGLVKLILVRRLITPEMLGIWNAIEVIYNFILSLNLGSVAAASRKLPILNSLDDNQKSDKYRKNAILIEFYQSLLLIIAYILYKYLSVGGFDYISDTVILSMVLLIPLINIFTVIMTSSQNFVLLSRILIIVSIFSFVIQIGLSFVYGVYGFIAGAVLSNLLNLFMLIYYCKGSIPTLAFPNFGIVKEFFKFGIKLKIYDYPQVLFSQLDSIFILYYFGVEPLAIYVTAKIPLNASLGLIGSALQVFVARFYNNHGSGVNQKIQIDEFMQYTKLLNYIAIPFIILIGGTLAQVILNKFLPMYQESVDIIIYLLFLLYFKPETTFIRNFLVINKRFKLLGIANILSLVTSCILLFIYKDSNLLTIAIVYVLSWLAYYLFLTVVVGYGEIGLDNGLKVLGHTLVSIIYVAWIILYMNNPNANLNETNILNLVSLNFIYYIPILILGLISVRSILYKKN